MIIGVDKNRIIRVPRSCCFFFLYSKTMRTYLSILLTIYLVTVVRDVICFDEGRFSIIHRYDDGFIGKLSLIPGEEIKNGWNMVVTFSEPIKKLEVWQASTEKRNKEKTVFALKGAHWHNHINAGQEFSFNFKVTTNRRGGFSPQIVEVAVGRTENERGLHCVGKI